ncbi:BTB/POZ domain-containing protein At3g19850 [Linum grandiflorum]
MTEAVSTGNLLKQTEHFLRGISSWSLPNVVSSLESCEPFFSYAKSLGLVEKLVSRVIAKIATSSPDTSSDCSSTSADDIGELLDQASLDDLLVTGHNGDHVRSVYDVDLVIRLVGVFVVYHHHQSQKMKRVVKLLDEYLREISPDHNLKMAKFMEVVESLPMAARESFDGVYRAIDIYLETHRSLSMEERSRLCGCLNFEKLSMEACKEMAKNPKIPPTISVQALMSKRSTIPNSIGRGSSTPSRMKLVNGDVYGYSCSPSTKGRIDQTRNNESDMDIEIEMNVVKMQERVVELERNCRKLKKEMSKMGKQHHGDGGGGLNKLMSLPSSCGKNMGWICY